MVLARRASRLAALLSLLSTLALARVAAAGGDDIVYLANGSLLRGTVMEEDPKTGVTILLLDGTKRHVAANEVGEIAYAGVKAASDKPADKAAVTPSAHADSATAPKTIETESGAPKHAPFHAFVDAGVGYGHILGGRTDYQIDAHAVAVSATFGFGIPFGDQIALGLGLSFSPIINTNGGFGPAGLVGVYLTAYPIPDSGFNASLLAGFGGGGTAAYGGIGPASSIAVGYDFARKTGLHPSIGVRAHYLPMIDPDHASTLYHQFSVAAYSGFSFH